MAFFDVDQGDATLVQPPSGCTALIDAGRHNGDDVPGHLSAAGVERIDYLIGAHPHADHNGQFPVVLSRFEVSKVWMSGWEQRSAVFKAQDNLFAFPLIAATGAE